MVGHENLVLQSMLCANGNNGLECLERTKGTVAAARRLAPGHFLFQDVEERHDIAKASIWSMSITGDNENTKNNHKES